MYDAVIEFELVDEIAVVDLCDDVDIANAATLERYIDEATSGRKALVVSLEKCRYIDSSGVRPLLRLAERWGRGFFVVVPPKTQVRRVFDLAALDARLNVCATRAEALARAAKGIAA